MVDVRGRADSESAAERHLRLKRIVFDADRLEGDARDRFLADACAGDDALARAAREILGGAEPLGRGAADAADAARPAAPAGDEQRAPERLGPYRVVREIGRGGMGVVYEAVDERDGTRAAVKAIHAHLLGNRRAEERFAREAAAGARVEHPNVVRTLAALRVEDASGRARSVLVTELVVGRTLRDLLRSLGRVPESLLREIARGIAAGVAAMHAAGIVHRDIKPENVMLTTDGRVRVMDLGIARGEGAGERMTLEGDFVGSLDYASPEQCEGGAAGPAADLYAIGVVLHELASGTNPFARDTALATVAAHLVHVAPDLGETGQASPFLAAVVATLLARDPAERFASADELARTLGEGEASPWWRERAGARRTPALAVPVARDLAFRGRSRALADLRDALVAARAGRAATVLVSAEAGHGKTRLLDAFLAGLDPAETHLLYGAIPPTGGPAGLSDAILGALGSEGVETWLAERAAFSPALASSVAAFLRREPAPQGSSPLDADAVEPALRRVLRALAAERPTVVALDDVHHAGPETGALLASLVRNLAEERVLLVLAGRPAAGASWMSDLAARPGVRSLVLPRLGSDDVATILRDALGSEDLALRAARRITAKSGGVPLYVAAMVASLHQALADVPPDRRAALVEDADVPMALREALAARLAALSSDERALVDVCAVQGAGFDAEIAAAALGTPLVRTLQLLAAIERRTGLVRADGRRFRFDHQLLQEVVDGALPQRLREEYHLATGGALAQRGRTPPEALARHFVASSDPALALPHLRPAIDALIARHENDAAVDLATRALAVEGLLSGPARADVLLRIADIHYFAARREEQELAAREALELAHAAHDPHLAGRAYAAVAAHLTAIGEDRRAVPRLRAAIRLARGAGDVGLEVRSGSALGAALMRLGRMDEARARLEAACALAVAKDDPKLEQVVRRALGLVDLRTARDEEARAEFTRCIELARRTGSLRYEGHAEGGLGVVEWHSGAWEAARTRFLRARDAGRLVGDRALEIHALGNVAVVLHAVGRCTEAIAALNELRPLIEPTGDRVGMTLMYVNLSQAHAHLGEREEAKRALDAAAELAAATGFARGAVQVLLCRGEAARNAGDLEGAARLFDDAARRLAEASDPAGRAEALLSRAETARAQGDTAFAITCADEALALAGTLVRPATKMLAVAARAALPGGDAAAAEALVALHEAGATYALRLRARYDLWLATRDVRHVAAAQRMLAEFLAEVPPARRNDAVTGFRLHREIAAACAEAGLPPPV